MSGYLVRCRRCRQPIDYAERTSLDIPRVVITVQETGFLPKSVELCNECKKEFIDWVNRGVQERSNT